MNFSHIPVLAQEVFESFDTPQMQEGGVFIDCTLGFGGHSLGLLERFPKIKLFGIDQDSHAIAYASKRLEPYKHRLSIKQGRFSKVVAEILEQNAAQLVGVLADIGVSSLQLDDKSRGFCFDSHHLDMRMDSNHCLHAQMIINHYSLNELERLFRCYGEITQARKMAQCIIDERKKGAIVSAQSLSALIARHFHHPRHNPATKAFQALRIEVNDELGEIKRLFDSFEGIVFAKNWRLGVISFHSLEDRIVKQHFKKWQESCICPKEAPKCSCQNNHQKGKIITKKPIIPSKQERLSNPRSRSAKLRLFEWQV